MSVFKISPVLSCSGITYVVRKKGIFFWSCEVQRNMFDASAISDYPFDISWAYDGESIPYGFKSVNEARDWIVREYGRTAEIQYWQGG